MPIYEYECQFCGKRTEQLQKISEPPLVDCPDCGKPGLHRLVSAPAFQLKGQGWYVTDFRGDKKEQTKTADNSGEKSDSEKKEVKKTDETKTSE